MKVKCDAMVDTAFKPQAAESNQTQVMTTDDSSAKTIEFLRARLLAERATSKSARQQAQEIAEKVKDLHIRLETEVEHRKEAEAAMDKVFSVLKAKGVVMDSILLAPTGLNGQSVGEALPSGYVDEAKEVSRGGPSPSHAADCPNTEGVQHPLGDRNESSTQKGILECTIELHGNPSVVEGTDFAEHQHCLMEGQDADHDKKVDYPDHATPADCRIPIFQEDIGTGQSIQQGLCITSKLKAMLQQIEEEVGALPEEQPLRVKLQGLVGHVANMLDRGQEVGLEIDHLGCSKQPDIVNCSTEGVTALETKNFTHMKLPVQSKYADAIHVNEAGRHPVNEMHEMADGIDRRERLVKSLFPSPEAQLQQRHLVSSTSAHYTPAIEDTSLHGNERKPSCDLVNGGNRNVYVGRNPLDRGPLLPQMIQYDNPHPQITCPPMIHCGHLSRGNSHMVLESPYLVEVPSPKSSDALSVGDKMGYTCGQHNEFWSPARASSGFEGQNAWSPARVERQSRAMLSNGYLINDISDDLLMKLERGYNHQNMYLQGGFSNSIHSHQARDLRNSMIKGTAWQQEDCFPFNEDRNGRLGGILMALDAARQRIQGEELMAQTAADARLRRGYLYGDRVEQLPPEFQQRSHSHAPIIQFPPSPTSEHGYSPFERPRGVHRRSSSVSTNFMMSGWDNSLQPRGEVHLGNGITLYTD